MRMFKKEEGFTLVELMVVVLIIGILVAIAIPVFNAAQGTARRGACQNNLRVLDGATQQWLAASPDNDVDDLGTTATDANELQGYVKDWAEAIVCPDPDATLDEYSVSSGDFHCDITDHNYDE